jgi:leucyl aminopeptidase
MKVSVTTIPLNELDIDLLLIPVAENVVAESLNALAEQFGEIVQRAGTDFSGAFEETLWLYPEAGRARRLALLGIGAPDRIDLERLRRVAARGAELARERKVVTVAIVRPVVPLDVEATSQALVEGFMLAAYRFTRYKTETELRDIERLVLHETPDDEKASRRGAERGRIIAECVMTARDLVNLSPDEKTPTKLARLMEQSAKKYGYEADVWDKALIEEEGMGGLLAVNRGSTEPPTFIILTWRPENALNERPVILVGKGVVFDTGGLSLKPTKDSMDYMKSDMAGAAAVVGTMEALARLKLPLYVIGLIPATDNRPGENAYVPGEVIRMHSGKTVEVLNTDAEGRLILADALSYARTYRPELVIDLATLTGAQIIALGTEAAAVMTNSIGDPQARLEAIVAAGERSGDRVHPLPMYEEYAKLLESDVADLKNIGGREAGSITAAKFLEHFVDYPWIHVDMAGPAFLKEPKPYRPKGGTGFGVRLLVEFLRDYASPHRRAF